MSENIMAAAESYSGELDRVFTAKSATAFLADNALRTKFVGAKTVIIPKVEFEGLGNYDRKTGFIESAVNIVHSTYTMTMDRAKSFSIDREDMDETGIASLAGKILGEYVRTKVVPECDAYVISKLTQEAEKRGNIISNTPLNEVYSAFNELISHVQGEVGCDEEIVCFMDSLAYSSLCASDALSRMITVSDFKQGELTLRVKKINGITIIPVVSERMRSAQVFEENGFNTPTTFSQVYMLALPKNAAHLVKKTEKMRAFAPEQNTSADAYKFDYRIYYDVFVKDSAANAIWAWESNKFEIQSETSDQEVPAGESAFLTISAALSPSGSVDFQWYQCDDLDRRGARKIGDHQSDINLPSDMAPGTYYFYCKLTPDDMASVNSRVCTVTII
jgi:hypothetical protein